jgi:hypothetical protein
MAQKSANAAVAAGAYGLSPSFAMAAPVPEKFDGSAFKLKAPEPNAKSGGVLRHGKVALVILRVHGRTTKRSTRCFQR